MRRRRKKALFRRLRYQPIFALALLINLWCAYKWSPLLVLTKVKVIGAHPVDEPAIRDIVAEAEMVSWRQIPTLKVESQIEELPGVDKAVLLTNVFGRGQLTVTYFQPIARLDGTATAVDELGQLFTTPLDLSSLPAIQLPSEATKSNASIANFTDLGSLAKLAAELPSFWPGFKGAVQLREDGSICLNSSTSSCRVVLGDTVQLDLKLTKLKQLVSEKPGLFSTTNEVNLIDPVHPVYRPLVVSHEPARIPSSPKK